MGAGEAGWTRAGLAGFAVCAREPAGDTSAVGAGCMGLAGWFWVTLFGVVFSSN